MTSLCIQAWVLPLIGIRSALAHSEIMEMLEALDFLGNSYRLASSGVVRVSYTAGSHSTSAELSPQVRHAIWRQGDPLCRRSATLELETRPSLGACGSGARNGLCKTRATLRVCSCGLSE